jgi:hypothetical protein
MMPCRVSVYPTTDGQVIISRVNTGLVSKLFGGPVAEVMAQATSESKQILSAYCHDAGQADWSSLEGWISLPHPRRTQLEGQGDSV